MWHWLQVVFGFQPGDGNSESYLSWSGSGSDLAYLSFLWAGLVLYRRHNCQVKRCPRIGRHEYAEPGTGVRRNLCWRHHPAVEHRQLTRERLHLFWASDRGRAEHERAAAERRAGLVLP